MVVLNLMYQSMFLLPTVQALNAFNPTEVYIFHLQLSPS